MSYDNGGIDMMVQKKKIMIDPSNEDKLNKLLQDRVYENDYKTKTQATLKDAKRDLDLLNKKIDCYVTILDTLCAKMEYTQEEIDKIIFSKSKLDKVSGI